MFNQIYFQEGLLAQQVDRNRYISRYVSALLVDQKPVKVNTSLFRTVKRWVSTLVLAATLVGCADQVIAQPTSIPATPTAKLEESDEKVDIIKYGCIGTIRTLALNNPDTGEVITRMQDHSAIRIDGNVSPEQDKILDNAAKAKEGDPNADYDWDMITYIDERTGEIFKGAAASNWIDPRNPVTFGCQHKPGQQVHEGYGDDYQGK